MCMNTIRKGVWGVGYALAATLATMDRPASAEVTFEWVTVGNPGNAADPLNSAAIPGIGSVASVYRIAKFEVTNAQYAEFLNAVAATDPNGLYKPNMGSESRGGITQSGSPGSFTYAVRANMGNKPVNFVSFFDAMRFVNWLHNGQPMGGQDASTTEEGVYTISDGISETRAMDAQFFIPTQNEWYKAAYHQPSSASGDNDDYWLYPTASNSVPTIATANATGDVSNPGTNVVNYSNGAVWNGAPGNVTSAGSAGPLSDSFYGAADLAGNVFEWNEFVAGTQRSLRGGSWASVEGNLQSVNQNFSAPSLWGASQGFRVASPGPPEPVGTCCISNGSCDAEGNCQESITQAGCKSLGGRFFGPNLSCAEVCANGACIPTVSTWGIVALLLLIVTAGTIVLVRRRIPVR